MSYCTKPGHTGYGCGFDGQCYPDQTALIVPRWQLTKPVVAQQIG